LFNCGRFGAAHGTQKVDCLGPGELFTGKAGYETTAPNFPLRFHAPQHRQQFPPRRANRFAGKEIAEEHSPSQQQLAGMAPGSFVR
jgi:hypothetical protein